MKRLLPSTLFGRLVLVLLGGLLIAQLVGAAILLRDRAVALHEAGGFHAAQRMASIVRVLETLEPEQRRIALRAVNSPTMRVDLAREPVDLPADDSWQAEQLRAILGRRLGDRPVGVVILERPALVAANEPAPHEMMPRFGRGRAHDWIPPLAQGTAFVVQAGLNDGTWVLMEQILPSDEFSSPYRLLLTLAVLLASVIILSLLAVRWVTRPLATLGQAAQDLGRDINRPPLKEDGPQEVVRAAHAFNAMQQRLQRYLRERSDFLAAVSHDLKTPITRLRLRAEMVGDAKLRDKFLNDLEEMERMTRATLDFLRGANGQERVQPIDVDALLESLQADFETLGQKIELNGTAIAPYPGRPVALRRCLSNLIDNAIKYGKRVTITIEGAPDNLRITIADEGPGIPEDQLEHVFEPFYRLEPSRSRETGGVGLGLSIARDIARAHGGELLLRNRAGAGLEASLVLPR